MTVLVICKISDQKSRKNIYSQLRNLGTDLIPGVYLLHINASILDKLQKVFSSFRNNGDCVTVYPLCADCQKNSLHFGDCGEEEREDSDWLVL